MKLIAAALVLISLQTGCAWSPFKKSGEPTLSETVAPKIPVLVDGVDANIAETIAAHITIARKACHAPARYLRQLTKAATEEAAQAMQAFGYYDAKVTSELNSGDDCPALQLTISPGTPVIIEVFDFTLDGEAQSDIGFEKLISRSMLTIGEVLHHGHYADAKQQIESSAVERGYLDGRFLRSELLVSPSKHSAEIHWHYDSGPRYQFGELTVEQTPDELDGDLIDRLVEYERGQPYHVNAVAQIERALSQSNYFAQTDVRPQLENPQGTEIPLNVTVKPHKRHSFSGGVGVSTDEGLRSRVDYLDRRLNRRGHRVSATGKASFIEQSLSLGYRIPSEFPRDEWLVFQGGIKNEDTDSFQSLENQISVSQTKRRPFDILESHYLEFGRQKFTIGEDTNTSIFLVPGARWAKSSANDPLYPTNGYAVDFEIRGAADALLSDTSFLRAALGATWITSPAKRSRILLKSELGAMWVDSFSALNPSERFLTGGDSTIRGYDYEELGPVDAEGDVVGGTYLGVVSLEYEYLLFDKWAAAAFVDAGNAFGGDGSSTGIASSVGVGIRWHSPVGPIRVDLAHPFDKDDAVVFHLRIGPDL